MTNNNKKRYAEFGKDIFSYGFMMGVSKLSGFILLPFFTRAFSTDQYGIIDIIAVVKTLLATFVCLSLANSVRRYFEDSEVDADRSGFISSMLFIIALTGLIIVIIGWSFLPGITELLLENSQYSLFIFIGILSATFDGLSRVPEMVLRMERKIVYFNLINIIHSISYGGIALYLVFVQGSGLQGVFVALILSDVIKLLLCLLMTRHYLTVHISYAHLKRSLKFSLPILPADMVNWTNNQISRLILLASLGLSGVGIFAAAARIGVLIKLPGMIFHQAWAPYSMTIINESKKERDEFYSRILSYYTGVFVCLCMVLTGISPEIFRLLLPEEYYRGYLLIPWLAGATILEMSRSITGVGVTISEKTYINSVASIASALVNVSVALLLIPIYGICGAAIGTFLSQIIFTGILGYFSTRFEKIPFQGKESFRVLICYIVSSILLIACSETIQNPITSMVGRLIIILLSITVVIKQTVDKPVKKINDIINAIRILASKKKVFSD